jgi:hypothetical protein
METFVDYRTASGITKKHSFPLSQIGDSMNILDGAKRFIILDIKNSYWQVDLHPHKGKLLWPFTFTPFDPATLQRRFSN